MEEPNPYGSPEYSAEHAGGGGETDVDPEYLKRIAARLDAARRQPPTTMGSLCQWAGLPRYIALSAMGIAALSLLTEARGGPLSSHWPAAFAGFIAGTILRDVVFVRRLAALWKPQSYFIDWNKVDDVLRQK